MLHSRLSLMLAYMCMRICQADERILVIGGQPAPKSRYPYAEVSLLLSETNHQCGGTLIAPDLVLTAAHCKEWFRIIQIDRHDFDSKTDHVQTFRAESFVSHPRFKYETFEFDFAVIQLNGVVRNPRLVRLNNNSDIPKDGDEVAVLGWGAVDVSNPFQPVYPSQLQIAHLDYVSNRRCEGTRYNGQSLYRGEIFPEMMCATRPGVDACNGDSGGPLIIEGRREGLDLQVGIASWGRGCAVYPGVYSRVSAAYPWIRQQVCTLSQNPPAYMECGSNLVTTLASPPEIVASSSIANSATIAKETKVTIVIQLDGRSGETGWLLSDMDGRHLAEALPGIYSNRPNDLVRISISVTSGAHLLFVITDTGSDGICCSHGVRGWYRVTLTTVDGRNVEVVNGNGEFRGHRKHSFVASVDVLSASQDSIQSDTPRGNESISSSRDSTSEITREDSRKVNDTTTAESLPGAGMLTAGLEEFAKSSGSSTLGAQVQAFAYCILCYTINTIM